MRGRAGGRGRPERQRRKTWTFRKFVSAGVGQRPALCRRPPSADLTSATIKETGGDAHSSRSVLGDETRRSRLYFCGGSFASCRSVPRVRRARRASPTELATRSSVAPHLSAEASSPCCGGKGGGGESVCFGMCAESGRRAYPAAVLPLPSCINFWRGLKALSQRTKRSSDRSADRCQLPSR